MMADEICGKVRSVAFQIPEQEREHRRRPSIREVAKTSGKTSARPSAIVPAMRTGTRTMGPWHGRDKNKGAETLRRVNGPRRLARTLRPWLRGRQRRRGVAECQN